MNQFLEGFLGRGFTNNGSSSYNAGSPRSNSKIKTVADLRKAKDSEKEAILYDLFTALNQNQRNKLTPTFNEEWEIYSGNDVEHKAAIKSLFNNEDVIYDSFEINSIVKNLAAKIIQPLLSRDTLVIPIPTPETINVYERVGALLEQQLKRNAVTSEVYKILKDGLIYGIGFAAVEWRRTKKTLPKKVITAYNGIDPNTGEETTDTTEEIELEEVLIEEPDITACRVSDILYPQAARWEDIPFCIRLQKINSSIFNATFGDPNRPKEFKDEFELKAQMPESTSTFATLFDETLDKIPGQEDSVGSGGRDERLIAHFHFADESYYVLELNPDNKENCRLVYSGSTPVPGLAIPIIPFIPEPVAHRIIGESTVLISKNDARKTMELDNVIIRDIRKDAASSFLIDDRADFNINAWQNRAPNAPFKVDGSLDGILPNPLKDFKPETIQVRALFKNNLDSITGVTDFFSGNIGRSARLSGVDSLLSNALSRLSPIMNQLEQFVWEIGNAFLLMNRAFLPTTYVELKSSIYASEPIEKHEIPLPFKFKISTAITSAAEKEVMLAGLSKAIEIALTQEQTQPGTWDMSGLMAHYLTEMGAPQVKRFMLKQPMTQKEFQQIQQIDKAMRLQANSALPNNETPGGIPMEVAQQGQPGFEASVSPQSMRQSGITETGSLG